MNQEPDSQSEYSRRVLEHMYSPGHLGILSSPDGYASYTAPCGDTMEIFLQVANNEIQEIKFFTDGCGSTVACGDVACEMAKGKGVKEAGQISREVILEFLGGLPEETEHCAELAARALKAALMDYLEQTGESGEKGLAGTGDSLRGSE